MNSTKCLACWEEIEEGVKICPHCGSNQENVKDFLALAVLKQQKKKITVPEKTPILEYIYEVDPEMKEEITVGSTAETQTPSSTYKPSRPSWLQVPGVAQEKAPSPKEKPPATISTEQPKSTEKTIICPNCSQEVKLLKFCKICGNKLQKECDKCGKINAISAKFCTGCGQKMEVPDKGEETT